MSMNDKYSMSDKYPRKGDIIFGDHYSGLVIEAPVIYTDGDVTLHVFVFFRLDVPHQTNKKNKWSFAKTNLPEIIRGNL
jgi:hypothetical protein